MIIDEKFKPVADLFFEQGAMAPAGGSALSIWQNGKEVLNIFQGEQSAGQPWSEKTKQVIFSNTKGLTSIMANQLIEMGFLDPEEKVAHYWPEFAQGGKAEIPVKWILQHKAGLSAVRRDLTLDELLDGHTVIDELAKQEPLWEPGAGHAYHSITFGYLVGKLIHAVTGKTAGEYFQEQIAGPLNIDAWIGLPKSELGNLATLISDDSRQPSNAPVGSAQYWSEKSMTFGGALPASVIGDGIGFNDPRVLEVEMPGINGVMSASAMAKIYSAAVTNTDGIRLLTDYTILKAINPGSFGQSVWGEPAPWATRGLGFMVHVPGSREYTSNQSFGHDGIGSQAAFGDLANKIGFGYTTSYLYPVAPYEMKNQHELIHALQKVLA